MSPKNMGFVKLWRSFFDSEDFKARKGKTNDRRIMCLAIICQANYKKVTHNGVTLQPGEIIITHEKLARIAEVQLTSVKAHLVALVKARIIECSKTFQGTRIKVINWEHYQDTAEVTPVPQQLKRKVSKKLTPTFKEEKKKEKRSNRETKPKNIVPDCDFFQCDELNKWVGGLPKSTKERWCNYADYTLMEEMTYAAKEWAEEKGKTMKSCYQFVENWWKRDKRFTSMEDNRRKLEFFAKYDK